MPITSHDSLLDALTSGQRARADLSRVTSPVHTAGGWHCLAGLNGSYGATTYPGTDLLWAHCDESGGDGTTAFGAPHGGAMSSGYTKHLLNASAMVVAAAGAPWQAILVDLLGYYRLSTTNVTGTSSRTLINSNTFTASSSSGLLLTYTNDFKNLTQVRFTNSGGALPTGLSAGTTYWLVRQSSTTAKVATSYANALAGTFVSYTDAGTGTHTLTIRPRGDGVGAEAAFVVQTQPTAGGPNLSASSYTNSAGTSSRAFQGSPTMGATADGYAARILHSGNAAGRYGPFLPKRGGDAGILSVDSFTWSGGTAYTGSGVVALCLMRPLLSLQLGVTGANAIMDAVNQFPSLPKIEDGACLTWLLFGTGATTTNSPFNSTLEFVWQD